MQSQPDDSDEGSKVSPVVRIHLELLGNEGTDPRSPQPSNCSHCLFCVSPIAGKPTTLRKKGELAQMVERALSMGEVEGSMSNA